ncbi:MAG: MCE family protein [Myxococcales bacterium]|nr:MCE family protein [Myxococcales bacterium]
MKHIRATVLVGLLVCAGVAALVIGVMRSNRGLAGETDTYVLRAYFDDVTGIAAGTKVTIAGYTVGQVESVQLVSAQVLVKVRLRGFVQVFSGVLDAKGDRKNGGVLTRLQASLLGDNYLALAPGAAGRALKDGDEIPQVVTTTELQATLKKLETAANVVPKIDKIAGDVAKITDSAARVLGSDEGAQRMADIADNLVAASRNLADTTRGLQKRLGEGVFAPGGDLDRGLEQFAQIAGKANTFADEANRLLHRQGATLDRTLDDAASIVATVRDIVNKERGEVETAVSSLANLSIRLDQMLQRAEKVVANVEQVSTDIKDGKGNVGRLLSTDTLVRDTEAVVAGAKGLVARYAALETGLDYRLAGYGRKLRGGQPPDDAGLAGPGVEWQSHFSLRLQPRKDMWVLATLTTDNLGKTTRVVRSTASSVGEFTLPVQAEVFTETEETFKFGLQYARRFGPVVVRGGLLESSAGGGIDVLLANDRFQLSADLFRFTQANRPRLRLAATWTFWQYVYGWFGLDEVLVPKRADAFVGLGVSITDDDLRILFASAPALPSK